MEVRDRSHVWQNVTIAHDAHTKSRLPPLLSCSLKTWHALMCLCAMLQSAQKLQQDTGVAADAIFTADFIDEAARVLEAQG